ncbi:unnamed protein product [Polarella glacialis]|uniref:Uncharacterized protein n=1 Tax=Polarella glacialis TaxID=89957 RepID=A0A813FM26_POLGL|nr:unnamed protein product [Polarella glacialis]
MSVRVFLASWALLACAKAQDESCALQMSSAAKTRGAEQTCYIKSGSGLQHSGIYGGACRNAVSEALALVAANKLTGVSIDTMDGKPGVIPYQALLKFSGGQITSRGDLCETSTTTTTVPAATAKHRANWASFAQTGRTGLEEFPSECKNVLEQGQDVIFLSLAV